MRLIWRGLLAVITYACAGMSWASMPTFQGPWIYTLTYAPGSPDTLFAAGQGVFKSVDGGRNWRLLSGVPLGRVLLRVDPLHGRRLLVLGGRTERDMYLESLDDGATWLERRVSAKPGTARDVPELGSIVLHARTPGLWLVVVNRYGLLRSVNAGAEWSEAAAPAEQFNGLLASGDAFHAHSGAQVFRSSDGRTWSSAKATQGEDIDLLTAFPDGVLVVRSAAGWYASRDQGSTWQPVPLTSPQETVPLPHDDARRTVKDRCNVHMSPANVKWLFALCTDLVRSATISIDFARQLRSTDGGVTWQVMKGHGLPGAWFPSALAMHPDDPKRLVVAWTGGRILRSEDGGENWEASEGGMLWPPVLATPGTGHGYGMAYLRETPLIQAVMRGDLAAIDALAASGTDLQAPGNLGRTAIGWAVLLNRRLQGGHPDAYWRLRAAGAKPGPQRTGEDDDLLLLAAQAGHASVVDDLLRSGWRLTRAGASQSRTDPALARLVKRCPARGGDAQAPCVPTLAGMSLEHWVNLHLQVAKPGEGAQLVLDLVSMGEGGLADRVAAFDAGRYSEKDVVYLLKTLPTGAAQAEAVFRAYKGRYAAIASADLYTLLIEGIRKPEWALEMLREDPRPDLGATTAPFAKALLLEMDKPDLAFRVLRHNRGSLGDDVGGLPGDLVDAKKPELAVKVLRQAGTKPARAVLDDISNRLVGSCDPSFLRRATAAGLRVVNHPSSGNGLSAMALALRDCKELPPRMTDALVSGIHAAGARLERHEWNALEARAQAALLRSGLRGYYRGFEGQTADIGVRWAAGAAKDYPSVQEMPRGSPADVAGVWESDLLTRVDGVDTVGMSMQSLILRVRGKPGTTVRLTLLRKNGTRPDVWVRRRAPNPAAATKK